MFVKQFYLETTVEREKDVQQIDVHRELEKIRVHLVGNESFSKFSRCIKVLCRLS